MLCTRCRIRTAVTDEDLCTFCSGTRPPLPGYLAPRATGPGGWGVGDWPRSPVGLSWAVTALLGTVIATDLAAFASGLHLHGLWAGYADGGDRAVLGSRGDWAEVLYGATAVAQLIAFLATAVVFVVWFHRASRNAEVFDPTALTMGPGWSVGGWFVPVANLWFPYRVAAGSWRASTPVGPEGARLPVSRAPLNLWWAAWVAAVALDRIAARMWGLAEEPGEIVGGLALVMAADALDIAAAVLAILFVRALTRMQVERAALRAPQPVAV
ncbi:MULTISPECIES: DUF4328 domain-containing protein [unclassified Streptomyces]|uniref:DUF4328 domain-containing protein n=1 Tax=unclassified Streptomyces TaxID=2593676 RepID=UPI00081F1AF9|nr:MULTISPECIES: DUF4328 domain-containing protein [unclassified Streptomyces]MYR95140.1 DUF4328 domain-containing protein [Streptomyces sp. SID4937]SCD84725.1 protein of unknown function [Streptomyces sp. ScaeMP-e83]